MKRTDFDIKISIENVCRLLDIKKESGVYEELVEELKEMLTYYEEGTQVTLTVERLENGQYEERQVTITLGQKPEEDTEPQAESQPQQNMPKLFQ